jgi:hypothetical protein
VLSAPLFAGLTIEFPRAIYHVSSRGNTGHKPFWDEGNRQAFLANQTAQGRADLAWRQGANYSQGFGIRGVCAFDVEGIACEAGGERDHERQRHPGHRIAGIAQEAGLRYATTGRVTGDQKNLAGGSVCRHGCHRGRRPGI